MAVDSRSALDASWWHPSVGLIVASYIACAELLKGAFYRQNRLQPPSGPGKRGCPTNLTRRGRASLKQLARRTLQAPLR